MKLSPDIHYKNRIVQSIFHLGLNLRIGFNVILILSIASLVGCSEMGLSDLARALGMEKHQEIYDCRSQDRTPWADSPHTEVMAHIIDLKSKRKVLHKGYYENTILQSPYDYGLSTVQTESHRSEQYFYDIRDLEVTPNFIRFVAVNEDGDGSQHVINKSNMSLSPINGYHWKRECQKRHLRSIEGAFENLLEQ